MADPLSLVSAWLTRWSSVRNRGPESGHGVDAGRVAEAVAVARLGNDYVKVERERTRRQRDLLQSSVGRCLAKRDPETLKEMLKDAAADHHVTYGAFPSPPAALLPPPVPQAQLAQRPEPAHPLPHPLSSARVGSAVLPMQAAGTGPREPWDDLVQGTPPPPVRPPARDLPVAPRPSHEPRSPGAIDLTDGAARDPETSRGAARADGRAPQAPPCGRWEPDGRRGGGRHRASDPAS